MTRLSGIAMEHDGHVQISMVSAARLRELRCDAWAEASPLRVSLEEHLLRSAWAHCNVTDCCHWLLCHQRRKPTVPRPSTPPLNGSAACWEQKRSSASAADAGKTAKLRDTHRNADPRCKTLQRGGLTVDLGNGRLARLPPPQGPPIQHRRNGLIIRGVG